MDIALTPVDQEIYGYFADIQLSNGDLLTGTELASAIVMSLYLDARAIAGEGIKTNQDPRGWWGDTPAYTAVTNDKHGSKLWLLQRSKQTAANLALAKDYVTTALQWLIDDGVATSLDINTLILAQGIMGIYVTVHRPQGQETFKYEYVWDGV